MYWSDSSFTQIPASHSVSPGSQVLLHVPLEQSCEPPHLLSQVPQLFGSAWTSVHIALQQATPGPQTLPHAPQLLTLNSVFTHALLQQESVLPASRQSLSTLQEVWHEYSVPLGAQNWPLAQVLCVGRHPVHCPVAVSHTGVAPVQIPQPASAPPPVPPSWPGPPSGGPPSGRPPSGAGPPSGSGPPSGRGPASGRGPPSSPASRTLAGLTPESVGPPSEGSVQICATQT